MTHETEDGSEITECDTLKDAVMLAVARARAAKEGSKWSAQDVYIDDEYVLTINTKGE